MKIQEEIGGYAGEHFKENIKAIIYPAFRDGKTTVVTIKKFFLTIFAVAVFLVAFLYVHVKKKVKK